MYELDVDLSDAIIYALAAGARKLPDVVLAGLYATYLLRKVKKWPKLKGTRHG